MSTPLLSPKTVTTDWHNYTHSQQACNCPVLLWKFLDVRSQDAGGKAVSMDKCIDRAGDSISLSWFVDCGCVCWCTEQKCWDQIFVLRFRNHVPLNISNWEQQWDRPIAFVSCWWASQKHLARHARKQDRRLDGSLVRSTRFCSQGFIIISANLAILYLKMQFQLNMCIDLGIHCITLPLQ